MDIASRVERLNEMIREDRIIRDGWAGTDEQGRETACLLAALSPEVGKWERAESCPAEVMPEWFAHMTPWIDDNGSEAEWPRVVRRYAACAARWHTLDEAAWRRVEIATRRVSVVEAMRHTNKESVLNACRGVLAWLDADMPDAARPAVVTAAEAAAAPEDAAEAAVWAEAAAAGAAACAAACAVDAAAAAACAKRATRAAAADRIADAILSALETECGL